MGWHRLRTAAEPAMPAQPAAPCVAVFFLYETAACWWRGRGTQDKGGFMAPAAACLLLQLILFSGEMQGCGTADQAALRQYNS